MFLQFQLPFFSHQASLSPSVFHSCQLSPARKADETVTALRFNPISRETDAQAPGPLCSPAPCLPTETASKKWGRIIDFLGCRLGIKCFAHLLTLRSKVQEPACATQVRQLLCILPFTPAAAKQLPQEALLFLISFIAGRLF